MLDKYSLIANAARSLTTHADGRPGLDVLVPQSRMSDTARRLLEAMGVSIFAVPWHHVNGPSVYRLLGAGRPRLTRLPPSRAEDLIAALIREEDELRRPQWVHLMLHCHRRGTLTDFDGAIDFGEPGLDVSRVLRDLLHYPG